MIKPEFTDPSQFRQLARPLVEKYVMPGHSEEFITGMASSWFANSPGANKEIKQLYIANPRYAVIRQSPTAITLKPIGGEAWAIAHDGRTQSTPFTAGQFDFENVDGVWYITDVRSEKR
jgi:hypothetical protein